MTLFTSKPFASLALCGFLAASSVVCEAKPTEIANYQALPLLSKQQVVLSGRAQLHLSSKTPIKSSEVNLTSPDAWLYLENVRPESVLTNVLPSVKVNGAPALSGVNVRVAQYAMGSVVIPQSPSFSPMQIFNQAGFRGRSLALSPNVYYNSGNLGKLSKAVASFTLKRGFMATLAQNPDGTGLSRIYIAQDGDLSVSALPAEFKNSVGFIRVLPWQWTPKKGWCGGDPELLVEPLWWYNWGETSSSLPNIEFVPMKWDDKGTTYHNINAKTNSTHLLGFNEPNGSDQANMTTDMAISEWPKLLQSGLRVGSPAPTDGGAGWLYDFMGKADAKNLRVDYVAVHFYRCGQSAQQLYNWLKGIHDRTGRPIWLTEWNNGANWTSCPDPTFEQNATVIKSWLDMMESTPWIERYSVYNWVEDSRAMVLNGKVTPAGAVYRDHASRIAYVQELPSGANANARFEFNGNTYDTSVNGNDGMAVGEPQFTVGRNGAQSLELDGVRSYVQLPSSVGSSADFSFSAWVNPKNSAKNARIFDLGDGTSRYLFLTPNSGDDTLRFAITNSGNAAEQRLDAPALKANAWTHVAVTIKGSTGKLWVNGAVVAQNDAMTLDAAAIKAKFNYLGKSQFGNDPLFAGQLQNVAFSETAFSPAQIQDLMSGDTSRLPEKLRPPAPTPIRGKVGVGTWGTQAEFKDIKVTQGDKVLFQSDFSKNLDGWTTTDGEWSVVDGALRQTGSGGGVRALVGDATWSNYTLSLKARKIGGSEGFLIFFGSPDDPNRVWANLGGWGNTQNAIQGGDLESPRTPGQIETGRWYDVRVEVQGPTAKVYLDGKLVQQATQ